MVSKKNEKSVLFYFYLMWIVAAFIGYIFNPEATFITFLLIVLVISGVFLRIKITCSRKTIDQQNNMINEGCTE